MKETIRQLFSILLLVFSAAGTVIFGQDSPAGLRPDDADLVHAGDIIEVDVEGSLEFDWRGGLNPEGFLDGIENVDAPVFALCRSENEIAAEITKDFSRILRDPKVKVRILDRSNCAVAYLDGAVRQPHRFQIKRNVNLNELLVLSGGITETASGEISIFRPKFLNLRVDAGKRNRFLSQSQPGESFRNADHQDQRSASGQKGRESRDIERRYCKRFAGPANIRYRRRKQSAADLVPRTTLSRAIAAAGGTSKEGDETKVTIFRREGSESRVIETDLRKIRDGQTEDPILKPYDIIEVTQKGRPKRKFPPVIDPRGDSSAIARLPLRIIE